ncbi:hypothetical protein NDU88_000572, partial [Pleurodeles waltl]
GDQPLHTKPRAMCTTPPPQQTLGCQITESVDTVFLGLGSFYRLNQVPISSRL